MAAAASPRLPKRAVPVLYLTVLVIATAGLVYELIAGTVASYVLGDSVFQFSTIIGCYLSAMGLGAYLSRFFTTRLVQRFIEVELAAALVGGMSAPFLFIAFARAEAFQVLLYGLVALIGILVGLELPLLMRVLERELDFKELVAKVLSFDYVGALIGSLLFALVLTPRLGLTRTSLLFGLLNCAVALTTTWVLGDLIYRPIRWRLRAMGGALAVVLIVAFVFSNRITRFADESVYPDPVLYSEQTPYQRIVVTQGALGVQLFLNGNLQFASSDEYRYHEALVHPAFAAARGARRVLVLGGGDGLAVREVLRHRAVETVTLVDLDPSMTRVARELPPFRALNGASLDDPRVRVIHDDAFVWLDRWGESVRDYDVVIVDFPDPNNFSLGKLYSRRFYRLLARVLHPGSAVVVQSTSPLYARRSFWSIAETMEAARLHTRPFHVSVPSFGEWGYVLAMPQPFDAPHRLRPVPGLRFLDDAVMPGLFRFGVDTRRPEGGEGVEVNRLDTQHLVQTYQAEWSRWQ